MLPASPVWDGRGLVAFAALAAVGLGCGSQSDNTVLFGTDGAPGGDASQANQRHDGGGIATTHDAALDAEVARDASVHDASLADRSVASADRGHEASAVVSDSAMIDHVVLNTDAASFQVPVVYGQSAGVLYAVNPVTEAVVTIGFFIGCDGDVFDIALNKSSVMYATTMDAVYTIDTMNAACTLLASGAAYPNSLSFVPEGTVDPQAEALVGYQGGTYVRIDTTTGALSTIGSLGGSTYTSSGDIVSVIGGGTYLTITGGSDCSNDDCLVEVDPTTGALITNYGSVHHAEVYGLAFWAGSLYGFDSAGELFRVSFPDAGALSVTSIPIPNPPFGLSFNGAGSTTKAPRH